MVAEAWENNDPLHMHRINLLVRNVHHHLAKKNQSFH